MKCQWLRGLWAASFLSLVLLFQPSCSSQQQQGEEAVAGEEGENAQANANAEGGEGFEGNIEGGGLEGGNNELLGGNAAGSNAAAEPAPAAGDNDLTNIINEMNQGGAPAAAPPPPAPAAMPAPGAPAAVPAAVGGGVLAGLAGQAAGPGLPEMGSKLAYIVKSGDTLAKIAGKILGDPHRFTELATLSNISDPAKIYPGDVIYYQLSSESLAFATDYENSSRGEATVQNGDTLATISQRLFGSTKQWRDLWRQNSQIANPNELVEGSSVYYQPKNTDETTVASVEDKDQDIKLANADSNNDADSEAKISFEIIENGFQLTSAYDHVAVDMTINLVDA